MKKLGAQSPSTQRPALRYRNNIIFRSPLPEQIVKKNFIVMSRNSLITYSVDFLELLTVVQLFKELMQLAWNSSVRYRLGKIPQLYPHLRCMNPSYILRPHRPGLKGILSAFSRLHLDRVSVLYPLPFPNRPTYKVPITLIHSAFPKIQLNFMEQSHS